MVIPSDTTNDKINSDSKLLLYSGAVVGILSLCIGFGFYSDLDPNKSNPFGIKEPQPDYTQQLAISWALIIAGVLLTGGAIVVALVERQWRHSSLTLPSDISEVAQPVVPHWAYLVSGISCVLFLASIIFQIWFGKPHGLGTFKGGALISAATLISRPISRTRKIPVERRIYTCAVAHLILTLGAILCEIHG